MVLLVLLALMVNLNAVKHLSFWLNREGPKGIEL